MPAAIHHVKLVDQIELFGYAFHDGVATIDNANSHGTKLIVAPSAAANDFGVQFGPFLVAVPGSWMQHDNAFACFDSVHERFAVSGCVKARAVHADYSHVGIGQLFDRLLVVFGIVGGKSGSFEGG